MNKHYRDWLKNELFLWGKAEKDLINAYSRKELIKLCREYYEDNYLNIE
jgi:hypothetical protein